MNTSKFAFMQTVLAVSLMAAHGTVWSADEPTVDELIKPSSQVSIGIGGWNNDRPNLGANDGMRKADTHLLLDADIRKRDETTGTWLNLSIINLGTRNREIRGEYLQQGKQGIILDYNEFRKDAPYTINSNNLGIGTTTQTLGANIPNTAIGSGTNYQFGTDRKNLGLSFYKNLMPDLDLNAKFSTETKKGNQITTNGSALFVADLIDRTTNKAEVTLNFNRESLQVAGGYYGSWFKNNNSLGYVTAPGGNIMTQPLDNQSHQLFANGSYRFTPTTKGTFKIAFSRGTQDEPLPTGNMAVPASTYALIPSLKGKVDTTLAQFGLTAKPMPKLTLVANLRYQDVADKTPQSGTVAQADGTGTLAINSTPMSYKTTNGKLEGTYLLPEGYSATAGIDYSKQDRTVYTSIEGAAYNPYVPFRSKLDETTVRLQLRKSLSETLNGSVAYLQGDRKGSSFETSTQIGTAQVSPVNSADRERQKLRFAMDWAPIEKLALQFNIETAKDNYGNGERWQGLQRGRADLYSMEVS